jgi:hypothetical protein
MPDSSLRIRALTARGASRPGEHTWLRSAAQARGRAPLAEHNAFPEVKAGRQPIQLEDLP